MAGVGEAEQGGRIRDGRGATHSKAGGSEEEERDDKDDGGTGEHETERDWGLTGKQ